MLQQQLVSSRSSQRTEPGGQELLRHECGPTPLVSAGVLGVTLVSTIHAVDGQDPLRTKPSAHWLLELCILSICKLFLEQHLTIIH